MTRHSDCVALVAHKKLAQITLGVAWVREGFGRPETLVWWRLPTFELLAKGLSYPPSKERSKALMIPATTQRKAGAKGIPGGNLPESPDGT